MSSVNQKPLISLLLVCVMILTFWVRIQGVERLPEGQFTENDAYLYYWQADIIAEHGYLPDRDMYRWLPLGRDNRQLLPLYAYAIGYIHKVFPWLSLYDIQLYLPTVCFTLGLAAVFLFLVSVFGAPFASIVALLLATLPGSIERSAAGFGDRDAWCWMLGVLAIMSYLWKEQMKLGRHRWISTFLAGFTIFLGGLSWEGFGLFVLIILSAELWKFCTTKTEEHIKEYLLWVLMFVPWLYLLSPAYQHGYGLTTHLEAFLLFPSLMVLVLRGSRYLLMKCVPQLKQNARKLSCGLTLLGLASGIGYIFFHYGAFEVTVFTVFENPLMKNVSELVDPSFSFWGIRYGAIFILGSLGWIAVSLHMWKWKGSPLATSLFLFIATTFFRDPVSNWIGDIPADAIFLISLGMAVVCLAIVVCRKDPAKNEQITIVMIVGFLLWTALARGGKRYDFFLGLHLAYGTAWLLWFFPRTLIQRVKESHLKVERLTAIGTLIILISISFLTPLGGHLTRTSYAAAQMREPTPGQGTPIEKTFRWMKTTLPENAVVAGNWRFGSRLNVLARVKTVTDQDHFLPHWIHLYYRHIFCAQDAREALEFLKTHKATHLMLTHSDVFSRAFDFSSIGSKNTDRQFRSIPLLQLSDKRLSRIKQTPFLYIEPINITSPPKFLTSRLKNGEVAGLPYVMFKDTQRQVYKTSGDAAAHGGVILYYNEKGHFENADYIPRKGWNSLAFRLYLRGEWKDTFIPVYPADAEETTPVKVWKIHYPPDIQTNPKYRKTGIPELDTQLQLQ